METEIRGTFVLSAQELADQLTVIIPAYHEEASVADTVRSVLSQTAPPAHVIVVDDGSTDDTAARAEAAGAQVVAPPGNTGSKAGAQNHALELVDTRSCMAIDADTTLAPDAIELLLRPLAADPDVAATCGFVVPRRVRTMWERGRCVEYLLSFTFDKPTQDHYGKLLISSGCFSAYRTEALTRAGGWSERTRAEDMDLTWSFYQAGLEVRFVPEAVCYPIEPHSFDFMGKQLTRWSHGFVQNVRLHWRGILPLPFLSTVVGVALFDAVVASLIYLLIIPLLAVVLGAPLLLLVYVIDVPAVLVPVMVAAWRRGEVVKAPCPCPPSSCCAPSTASTCSRHWSPRSCCAVRSWSTRRVTDVNNAGLPGTGLGGLFYLVLALWMPVGELVRTLRGESSPARWRQVGAQFALACGIIVALAVTWTAYLRLVHTPSPFGLDGPLLVLAPIALAGCLLTVLFLVLRVWAKVQGVPRTTS